MSEGRGKHARHRAPKQRSVNPAVLGHAAGITALVVGWGYLVWLAIDFGTSAREGDSSGWWLLVLAGLGAVACLFIGLILASRLAGLLGLTMPTTSPGARSRNGAAEDVHETS